MIFIMVVTTGTGSLVSQTLFPVLVGVAGSAAGLATPTNPGKRVWLARLRYRLDRGLVQVYTSTFWFFSCH